MFTISTDRIRALGAIKTDSSIALSDFLKANLPIEEPSTTLYNTTDEFQVDKEPVIERLRALRERMIESGGSLLDIDELQRVGDPE